MRMVIFTWVMILISTAVSRGDETVDAAIARMSAVFSGSYKYNSTMVGQKYTRAPELQFTFSGNSWRLVSKVVADDFYDKSHTAMKRAGFDPNNPPTLKGERETITVSHRGKTVQYGNSPQLSEKVVYAATVESGEVNIGADKREARPPMFGTCWYSSIRDFVTKRKKNAVHKGSAVLDSYPVEVYVWVTSKEDPGPYVVGMGDKYFDGGSVTMYISPKMGHVCPKIEFRDKTGGLCGTLTATDFHQVNDFWVPRHSKQQANNEGGQPDFWVEWSKIESSRLNDVFPEDTFTVEFRPGTEVSDYRSGNSTSFFVVKDGSSVPDGLNDVLVPEGTHRRPWYRTVWGAVGIGLGVGLLVLAALFAVRILRARGKPA
jgi:hypothetical protein